jgi:hypothetical protein
MSLRHLLLAKFLHLLLWSFVIGRVFVVLPGIDVKFLSFSAGDDHLLDFLDR